MCATFIIALKSQTSKRLSSPCLSRVISIGFVKPAFSPVRFKVPLKIKKVPDTKAFIPFNSPSTISGHPIVVIPIGITKKGLPIGVQIHGQKWHDYKLLQIAKEF